jgi:hypothetical protein
MLVAIKRDEQSGLIVAHKENPTYDFLAENHDYLMLDDDEQDEFNRYVNKTDEYAQTAEEPTAMGMDYPEPPDPKN